MGSDDFVQAPIKATLAEYGPPGYTGTNLHTSAQALAIPLVWGTRRIAPNVVWAATQTLFGFLLTGTGSNATVDGPDVGPFNSGYQATGSSFPDHWAMHGPVFGPGSTETPVVGPWFGQITLGNGAIAGRTYGGLDSGTSHAFVPTIMALCEGPVNGFIRMWNGGASSALSVSGLNLYTQTLNPPSLFYVLFTGTSSQAAWPYFAGAAALGATPVANQSLSYRFTAYIASAIADWGSDFRPPQQSFEIVRTPDLTAMKGDSMGIGDDYAPDAFIVDFLTSALYGMGLSGSDIDSASLDNFKSYVRPQGIYLSPLLDAQTAATDIIDRWALLTNTWIFFDGSVLRFVPLGDEALTGNGQTYTPDTTAAYDIGFGDFLGDGLQVDRADPIDCNNRVRLEISDRGADYAKNPIEWKDSTLINQFGLRDASNIDADDICDPVVGAIVADLIGKRMAYLRVTYTFSLASSRYILVLPGTIVTLTDAHLGLDHVPARIRTVQESADGSLSILAEEYPGTLGIARPQPVQAWSQNGGVAGGSSSSGSGAPGTGGPGASSGGTGTVPEAGATPSVTWFLTVAGDVWTMPVVPVVGWTYEFTHDLLRFPQPSPATLEDNPVTFLRPSGATYVFEDPQDRGKPAASSATWRVSGSTCRWRFDGGSRFRCVSF